MVDICYSLRLLKVDNMREREITIGPTFHNIVKSLVDKIKKSPSSVMEADTQHMK